MGGAPPNGWWDWSRRSVEVHASWPEHSDLSEKVFRFYGIISEITCYIFFSGKVIILYRKKPSQKIGSPRPTTYNEVQEQSCRRQSQSTNKSKKTLKWKQPAEPQTQPPLGLSLLEIGKGIRQWQQSWAIAGDCFTFLHDKAFPLRSSAIPWKTTSWDLCLVRKNLAFLSDQRW